MQIENNFLRCNVRSRLLLPVRHENLSVLPDRLNDRLLGRDEASFYSMVELFLSIPIESQCCQSYGVCGAQFVTDVSFER